MLNLIDKIFRKKKTARVFKQGDIVVEKDDHFSFYEVVNYIDDTHIVVSFLGRGQRRLRSPALHFRDKADKFRPATRGEISVFNNV